MTMITKKHIKMKILFYIFTLNTLFLFSCNKSSIIFEQHQSFKDAIWEKDNQLVFDLPIKNNLDEYKIDIVFTHSLQYQFTNIYLSMTIIAPDSSNRVSSGKYHIKNEHGAFIGKESEGAYTIKNTILKKTAFNQKGTYQIILRYEMPFDEINGILNAGIIVSKTEKANE